MSEDTLETITGQINAHWNKADDHRATLGVLMARAKELVEAGDPFARGLPWSGFVAINFLKKNGTARTIRDCQRLLQIGHAKAKADEEREKTRDQVAKSRDIRMSRPVPPPSPIDPREDMPPVGELPAVETLPPVEKLPTGMYDELVTAWELADEGERQRFCEYANLRSTMTLGEKLSAFPKITITPPSTPPPPRVPKGEAPPCGKPSGVCGYGSCSSRGACQWRPPPAKAA